MNKQLTYSLAALAIGVGCICTPSAKANSFLFHVDLNTSALLSAPNGPFYLDFQLNYNTGTQTNTAILSNFTFANGSAIGTPTILGDASGDLGSSIFITDNSANPFNEIFQGFSAGTTDIQFDISLPRNPSTSNPDELFVAILDSESGNPNIATNDPSEPALLTAPITPTLSLSDVGTFTSTSPAGVTTTVSAVPEPSAALALVGGIGMLLGFRRKRA